MSEVIDIPSFSADDKRIVDLMRAEQDDWPKKCFEAALTHLASAYRIREIDPAMAIFRAITAEEEAATGLLRSLQLRQYPDSKKLRAKDHFHKAAVYPFILAVIKHSSYLKINGVEKLGIGIPKDEENPRLVFALVLNGENEGVVARPNPPLNFTFREGDDQKLPDYSEYLLKMIGPHGFDDVRHYLKEKANERNRILYASPQGLVQLDSVPDDYFVSQKNSVITILKTYLLIWPYSEIQPFVEEAIQAFLNLTGRLKNELRQT